MDHTLTVLASWPPLYASSLFLSASKPHYAVAYLPPAIPVHVLSAFDVLSPPAKTNCHQPVCNWYQLSFFGQSDLLCQRYVTAKQVHKLIKKRK